jgi:hypothetical protein
MEEHCPKRVNSCLIVEEKDVFVHSCLDFSKDGRGPFSESQVHCCNQYESLK